MTPDPDPSEGPLKTLPQSSDKPRVALVLSSGAARGLAHIGVIEWLEENGVEIASIAGSSMGALIGGVYAAGRLEDFRQWVCALDEIDVIRMLDLSFTSRGLMRGEKLVELLQELVGGVAIESLGMPFTAVAADVEREEEIWMTSGPLFDAIRASIAIPMVLTPHEYRGRVLFDGGLLNPLPIAPAFAVPGAWRVAVNVNGHPDPRWERQEPEQPQNAEEDGHRRAIKSFIAGLGNRSRDRSEGWNLFEIALASFDTMQGTIARMKLAAYPADLTVTIPRNRCGAHQFFRAREMIDFGREMAAARLGRLLGPGRD
ncbi:MAG: patatin-like phospholipase family protein [Pseudomonadota bacterium]